MLLPRSVVLLVIMVVLLAACGAPDPTPIASDIPDDGNDAIGHGTR